MAMDRVADELIKVLNGEKLYPGELEQLYDIKRRTLQRDIKTINEMLSENDTQKKVIYNRRFQYYSLKEQTHESTEIIYYLLRLVIGTRSLKRSELEIVTAFLLQDLSQSEQKLLKSLIASGVNNYTPVKHDVEILPLLAKILPFIAQKQTIDYVYQRSSDGKVKKSTGLPLSVYFADHYFYVVVYTGKHQRSLPYRLDQFIDIKPSKNEKILLEYSKKLEDGVLKNKTFLLMGGREITYTFRWWAFLNTALDKLPNSKVIKEMPDGSVIIQATSYEEGAIMWILSQGTRIQVLTPPTLVNAVKEELTKNLAMYQM